MAVRDSDRTIFGPDFPQAANPLFRAPRQTEDCLYLNVWTNNKTPKTKQPVLVWIYGGGFSSGGSACPIYDGEAFAKQGVVFVSINYRVGVFGFFAHPNGAVVADNLGNISGENVSIFAVDTFYDAPLSDKGSSITAYAVYQNNNYGKNYLFNAYGTGSMIYSHLGYTLAGDTSKTRFQPYVSFAKNSYDATKDNRNILGIGANAYFNGHNSKVTLEYQHQKFGVSSLNTLTLQAMIYL